LKKFQTIQTGGGAGRRIFRDRAWSQRLNTAAPGTSARSGCGISSSRLGQRCVSVCQCASVPACQRASVSASQRAGLQDQSHVVRRAPHLWGSYLHARALYFAGLTGAVGLLRDGPPNSVCRRQQADKQASTQVRKHASKQACKRVSRSRSMSRSSSVGCASHVRRP
jgi:hypothetical protein